MEPLALENQTSGTRTVAQTQTQTQSPIPRPAQLTTDAETCLTDISKNNSKIMADKRFKINLIIILHLITLIVASFESFKIYEWNNRMNFLKESQREDAVQNKNQNQNPVFHMNKIFLNCSIPNKENLYLDRHGQFNRINMDIHIDLRIRPSSYHAFSILFVTSLVAILAGIFVLCQNLLPESRTGAPAPPSPLPLSAPFLNQSRNGNLIQSLPPEIQVTVEQEQELQRPSMRLRNEQSTKGSASVGCYIFLGLVAHVFNCIHLASIINGLNNANNDLQDRGQGQTLSQGQGHFQVNQLCTYAAMPSTTPLPTKEQELGIMVLELLLILPSLIMPWLRLLGTMLDTNNGHDPGPGRDQEYLSLPLSQQLSYLEVDFRPEDHAARTAAQKIKAKEAQILSISKQQSITLSLLQRVNAALQNNNVQNPNQLNVVVRNGIEANNNAA